MKIDDHYEVDFDGAAYVLSKDGQALSSHPGLEQAVMAYVDESLPECFAETVDELLSMMADIRKTIAVSLTRQKLVFGDEKKQAAKPQTEAPKIQSPVTAAFEAISGYAEPKDDKDRALVKEIMKLVRERRSGKD